MAVVPKPFLMWAGGKSQLIPSLTRYLPRTINTYFEPFLGGAALFFYLKKNKIINKAVLSDKNDDLITAYRYLQIAPLEDLVWLLRQYQTSFRRDPEFFYHIRRQQPTSEVTKAARIIFLNRTCYRGLFRVNQHGQYNVGLGTKRKHDIVRERLIATVATALNPRDTEIVQSDFKIAERAEPGDLVYFDPPYMPISSDGNFTGYTAEGFGGDDWSRLVVLAEALRRRGVNVMISQAYSKPAYEPLKEAGWNVEIVDVDHIIGKRAGRNIARREVIIRSF